LIICRAFTGSDVQRLVQLRWTWPMVGSALLREPHRFVSADPLVLLSTHVAESAHSRMHDARQVALDETRVPTGNGHLGRKRVG